MAAPPRRLLAWLLSVSSVVWVRSLWLRTQTPLTQSVNPGQTLPQAPQLVIDVRRSAHPPPPQQLWPRLVSQARSPTLEQVQPLRKLPMQTPSTQRSQVPVAQVAGQDPPAATDLSQSQAMLLLQGVPIAAFRVTHTPSVAPLRVWHTLV